MILSKEERAKFAEWLELLALDNEALAVQLDKLPGQGLAAQKYRMEVGAALVILRRLRTTETA